jgi:hypothetical protein
MAMKNLGKPNLSANLKTGFKLMGRAVSRGAQIQKPSVANGVASNHPIASARAAISGGKKKSRMY